MLYPFIERNLKSLNKRLTLELIRFTPGGISRAELARKLNLTRSAITTIVNYLLADEYVREATNGTGTSSGRRPIMLEMNPRRGYLLGVDIGATHLSVLATDFSAKVLSETEKPFNITTKPEAALQEVDTTVREVLADVGLTLHDLMGIGVGVPGPVMAEQGLVVAPPIMPGWGDFPIRERLQTLWGIPVSLNNDAELGALGEWAHGAGRGERHLAYIKVGSGVGAGFLFDGNIYHGVTGSAGEIGHVTIDENGPKCTCGNYGCLEAMAGGFAIARQAQAAARKSQRTQLASIEPLDQITAEDVAKFASRGDLVSQQIISRAGSYLGIAIAGMINLLNPGMVVIGGGVAQMGDLLLDPIRQAVLERSLKSSAQTVRINAAVLGRRSTSMGGAIQAMNIVLDQLLSS